jgi:hypothetical protein
VQGFDRCRTPPLKVDVGEHTAPGATNVHGTSAAAAVPANANAVVATAATMSFFIFSSPLNLIYQQNARVSEKDAVEVVKKRWKS